MSTFAERLKAAIAAKNTDQSKLARAIGVKPAAVNQWSSGETSPTLYNAEAAAKELEVDFYEFFTGRPVPTAPPPPLSRQARAVTVELLGYAGARDIVNVPEGESESLGHIKAPLIAESWQAVIVRGRSMTPAYWPGELLFFRKRGHDLENLYGRDCIVQTERNRRYLKIVKKGREAGTVDLESYAQDIAALRDVTLQWAAPIEVVQRGRR